MFATLMHINDNIRKYRKLKKLTQQQVADAIGEKRSTYAEWESEIVPKTDIMMKIASVLEIGIDDIMEIDDKKTKSFQQNLLVHKNGSSSKRIPFFEVSATAGDTEIEMSANQQPAGTIDVGDLLKDSEAAIRIYGNSMISNYPPGCVVGLVEHTENFIEPGEVYVIQTRTKRILKRLFYKDDDPDSEFLMCYSDNTMVFTGGARNGKLAYPPFNLHKSDIIKLFTVTGVIKRNANSMVITKN